MARCTGTVWRGGLTRSLPHLSSCIMSLRSCLAATLAASCSSRLRQYLGCVVQLKVTRAVTCCTAATGMPRNYSSCVCVGGGGGALNNERVTGRESERTQTLPTVGQGEQCPITWLSTFTHPGRGVEKDGHSEARGL